MAAQRGAGDGLVAATAIHGSRVEIVHAVGDGIIHKAVHLLLLAGKAHHAEAQQRDVLARAILAPVGHLDVIGPRGGGIIATAWRRWRGNWRGCRGKRLQRPKRHQRESRGGADAQTAQELAPTELVVILVHGGCVCLCWWKMQSVAAAAGQAPRRSDSFSSMSRVIEAKPYCGRQPHSSRAALSSRLSGHDSAIACFSGST